MNVPPIPPQPLSAALNTWTVTSIVVFAAFFVVAAVILWKNRHEKQAKRDQITSIISAASFGLVAVVIGLNLVGIAGFANTARDRYVAYFRDAYGLTVTRDHAMPDHIPGTIIATGQDGVTRTYMVQEQGAGLALYGVDNHQLPAITH